MKSLITKLKPLFYFLFLAVISISEILGILFPMTLLGKNIFLVVPFLILFFLIVHFVLFRKLKEMLPIILCFGLLSISLLLASFMHLILYNESLGFLEYRFVFQIALSAGFTVVMLGSIGRDQIYYVVISVIILVLLVQGIGYFIFPEIQIIKSVDGPAKIMFDAERTRDGLLGSSLVAYHAVLGLFAITSQNRISAPNLLVIGFIVLVIFSTKTRLVIIFMPILLLTRLIWKIQVKELGYWLIGAIIFLIVVPMIGELSEINLLALDRFDISYSDYPRVFKTILSLNLMSDSLSGFLWGLPAETINNATLGGFQVSDNSLLLISLRFGFIFFVVWVGSAVYLLSRFNRLSVLYWIWIFLALFTTNSILWDSFIFCLIGLAAALGQSAGVKKQVSIIEKPNFS